MFEFRRDHDLPSVADNDVQVVPKLAEVLEEVVAFRLPAVGIVHIPETTAPEEDTHTQHQQLVLRALGVLKPRVQADSEFSRVLPFSFAGTTLVHADDNGFKVHDDNDRRPKMTLRLHTAEPVNGAHAVFVNAAPGVAPLTGDLALFSRDDSELEARGYDLQAGFHQKNLLEDLVGIIRRGSYNPIATAADVFHFQEDPLSSVVFRSSTSFGPSTVHGFESVDSQVDRLIATSDVTIYSQSL